MLQPDLRIRNIEIRRLLDVRVCLRSSRIGTVAIDVKRIDPAFRTFDFNSAGIDQHFADFVTVWRLSHDGRHDRHGFRHRSFQIEPDTRRIDANHFRAKRRLNVLRRQRHDLLAASSFCRDRSWWTTSLAVMSRITFDEPRSRTWTVLVMSPVISSCGGMLRYSSGTSSPISDDASLATAIHSIAARTSETILRSQL